ncbi:MAG: pyridoxamine 5'-phosphate oxidase [Solirubrobacterales bacterium]
MSYDYGAAVDRPLTRESLDPDPFVQFDAWFAEASEVVREPEAMCLSTADRDGNPDSRMVLLKGVGPEGFRFFTNYEGAKAAQLEAVPAAALLFFWADLERQIRIRGPVAKLPPEESDAYYATRGRNSRLGAWASPQSQVIPDRREELDRLQEEAAARFEGEEEIPRPGHWGGYLVTPVQFEFWQGRQARLHDRFRYLPEGDGWRIERLAP